MSGIGPTANSIAVIIFDMTPMQDQSGTGHADLLAKIEHCRRLAREVPDLKTAQQLLELAYDYLKQLVKTKAQ
jgi:hypothetical protein